MMANAEKTVLADRSRRRAPVVVQPRAINAL